MATFRVERIEYFQPIIGQDPQLYVYNHYLRNTTTGEPAFVQLTNEYPDELDWASICSGLTSELSPDTLDVSCPA